MNRRDRTFLLAPALHVRLDPDESIANIGAALIAWEFRAPRPIERFLEMKPCVVTMPAMFAPPLSIRPHAFGRDLVVGNDR